MRESVVDTEVFCQVTVTRTERIMGNHRGARSSEEGGPVRGGRRLEARRAEALILALRYLHERE